MSNYVASDYSVDIVATFSFPYHHSFSPLFRPECRWGGLNCVINCIEKEKEEAFRQIYFINISLITDIRTEKDIFMAFPITLVMCF